MEFKKLEQILISKRILFWKIVTMHGKGEFFKIKGIICNILLNLEMYAIFYQGQQSPMD